MIGRGCETFSRALQTRRRWTDDGQWTAAIHANIRSGQGIVPESPQVQQHQLWTNKDADCSFYIKVQGLLDLQFDAFETQMMNSSHLVGSLRCDTKTTLLAPWSMQYCIVGTANAIFGRAGSKSSVGRDALKMTSKSTWINTRFPFRLIPFSCRRSLPMTPEQNNDDDDGLDCPKQNQPKTFLFLSDFSLCQSPPRMQIWK